MKSPERSAEAKWEQYLWGLFLIVGLLLLSIGLFSEFYGGHDGWCASRRGTASRNALALGMNATHWGMTLNTGAIEGQALKPYWHHPQGIHWLITGFQTLFGQGTWQIRAVPLLLAVSNVFLLLRLCRQLFPQVPRLVPLCTCLSIPC